jgi:CRP/FNR family transcriptional regulator, cyclic AMP receptor protein
VSSWRRSELGALEGIRVDWTLLAGMSDEDRRWVLSACRRRRFGRGEALFREGEPGESLHLLAEGTVAVNVATPMGDVATLDVIAAGQAFGEQALVAEHSIRSATAVALEPVQTLELTRNAFERVLAEHSGVLQLLVEVLDARLRATSQNLLDALYLPVETRVYRRLARLGDIYASREAIPLTQDELAQMVGTTRQSLNRVLRKAQDDGIVILARGRVRVIDAEAVARRSR